MSVPVSVPFLLHIVPFSWTKVGGQGSRAHKGNGTFVPSRFPSRFGPVVSRCVSRVES
jgi:hypothetical protein